MVTNLLVLFLVVASALAATHEFPRIEPSVIGGKSEKYGAHPYQISLRSLGFHGWCSGSIVDKEWVVTAAHCVVGKTASYLTIVAGTNSLSEGGDTYQVLEIYYHEKYDSWNIQNDVAILKVEPFTFSENVTAIAVQTEYVGGDEPCILSGWGTISHPGSIPDDTLQDIDLKTTTVEHCSSRHSTPVIDSEICTYPRVDEGACHGDSGGPLVREVDGVRILIGIASWGEPCALGYPDVFSRVSYFVPWFNRICNCLS